MTPIKSTTRTAASSRLAKPTGDSKAPIKKVEARAPRVSPLKFLLVMLPVVVQAVVAGDRRTGPLLLSQQDDICPPSSWELPVCDLEGGAPDSLVPSAPTSSPLTTDLVPTARSVVTALVEASVNTMFFGERHHAKYQPQPGNMEMNAQGLLGALDSGRPVHYSREVGFVPQKKFHVAWDEDGSQKLVPYTLPEIDRERDHYLSLPNTDWRKERVLKEFLQEINGGMPVGHDDPSAKLMKLGLDSDKLELRTMSFKNPERLDTKLFLEDKALSIASVGLFHAVGEGALASRSLGVPWMSWLEKAMPEYQVLRDEQYEDMWNGFARALDKGAAVVAFQGEIWRSDVAPYLGSPKEMYGYFNEHKGCAVLELPLGPGGDITFIGPADVCLPVFAKVAQVCGGQCTLYCDTLPGCPPEHQKSPPAP